MQMSNEARNRWLARNDDSVAYKILSVLANIAVNAPGLHLEIAAELDLTCWSFDIIINDDDVRRKLPALPNVIWMNLYYGLNAVCRVGGVERGVRMPSQIGDNNRESWTVGVSQTLLRDLVHVDWVEDSTIRVQALQVTPSEFPSHQTWTTLLCIVNTNVLTFTGFQDTPVPSGVTPDNWNFIYKVCQMLLSVQHEAADVVWSVAQPDPDTVILFLPREEPQHLTFQMYRGEDCLYREGSFVDALFAGSSPIEDGLISADVEEGSLTADNDRDSLSYPYRRRVTRIELKFRPGSFARACRSAAEEQASFGCCPGMWLPVFHTLQNRNPILDETDGDDADPFARTEIAEVLSRRLSPEEHQTLVDMLDTALASLVRRQDLILRHLQVHRSDRGSNEVAEIRSKLEYTRNMKDNLTVFHSRLRELIAPGVKSFTDLAVRPEDREVLNAESR